MQKLCNFFGNVQEFIHQVESDLIGYLPTEYQNSSRHTSLPVNEQAWIYFCHPFLSSAILRQLKSFSWFMEPQLETDRCILYYLGILDLIIEIPFLKPLD